MTNPTRRQLKALLNEVIAILAVEGVFLKDPVIWVKLPKGMTMPKGFPQQYGIEKFPDGSMNKRYSVPRVLKWMRENGYTTLTVEEIGFEKMKLTRMLNEFDKEI